MVIDADGFLRCKECGEWVRVVGVPEMYVTLDDGDVGVAPGVLISGIRRLTRMGYRVECENDPSHDCGWGIVDGVIERVEEE